MSFIIQKINQWFVSLSVKKNLTIVWGGPWPPVAPPGSATDNHMFFQSTPKSESFITLFAIEWLLSGMDNQVIFQICSTREGFIALITEERLLTSVLYPCMRHQSRFCKEPLLTLHADEWFLPGMIPCMFHQIVLISKLLVTITAYEQTVFDFDRDTFFRFLALILGLDDIADILLSHVIKRIVEGTCKITNI